MNNIMITHLCFKLIKCNQNNKTTSNVLYFQERRGLGFQKGNIFRRGYKWSIRAMFFEIRVLSNYFPISGCTHAERVECGSG